jgi:hypothetical protein
MFRIALLSLALASPAYAAPTCGPRQAVVAALKGNFGESVVARGYSADPSGQIAAVMETWVNATNGSWTVLMTTPAGVSCIAASGGRFEAVAVIDGDPA